MLEAAVWLGMSAGPLVSAEIIKMLSPQTELVGVQRSFFFSAGFITLAVLIVALFFRETIPAEKKQKMSWVRAWRVLDAG